MDSVSLFGSGIDTTTVGIRPDFTYIPTEFSLAQNYPNPFNPVTVIRFALPNPSDVSLVVFNIKGQEVALLINGNMPIGNHRVSWDASNFSSSIYFYRLRVEGFVQTRKMLLLK